MSDKTNMFNAYINDEDKDKEVSKTDSETNDESTESSTFKSPDRITDEGLTKHQNLFSRSSTRIEIIGDEVTELSSSLPKFILPWQDNISIREKYTQKLIEAGYTTVELIATASADEISDATSIPIDQVEKMIELSHNWHEFKFDTAASILAQRSEMVRLSTGCASVDHILGGGIEPKSITEFYGEFITGKTQICMQTALMTALPVEMGGLDSNVVYIDTEGSFRPERIVQMAGKYKIDPDFILKRIFVARAHNSDIQMKLVNNVINLAKHHEIKLLIIDSLTSNFRSEFIGKHSLVERQQKLNRHLQQIMRVADILDLAVIITNQVMSSMDENNKTVIPVGGNILAHGSTHRIHFTKQGTGTAVRNAKLVASPSLPLSSTSFMITKYGIEEVH